MLFNSYFLFSKNSKKSLSQHSLLPTFLVSLPHLSPTAITLWKNNNNGDTTAVCFDCQVDEFEESFGEHGPLTGAHQQVLEKWCSGIPGEGDDDVQMVDSEEKEDDEDDESNDDDDDDGEEGESEGEENGAAEAIDGAMEVEDSDDSEEEMAGWKCKMCTMVNADDQTKCGACDVRKPRR
jgi:hypothetical protein